MKLNINCVRDVLLQCENIPFNGSYSFSQLTSLLPNYTDDEIAYTCLKLHEGNYLHIVTKNYGSNVCVVRINDISFQGHEFLNNIRSNKVWNDVLAVGDKIGTSSINGFVQIATGVVTALIKNQLGI